MRNDVCSYIEFVHLKFTMHQNLSNISSIFLGPSLWLFQVYLLRLGAISTKFSSKTKSSIHSQNYSLMMIPPFFFFVVNVTLKSPSIMLFFPYPILSFPIRIAKTSSFSLILVGHIH